jgi:hypothetical protein
MTICGGSRNSFLGGNDHDRGARARPGGALADHRHQDVKLPGIESEGAAVTGGPCLVWALRRARGSPSPDGIVALNKILRVPGIIKALPHLSLNGKVGGRPPGNNQSRREFSR